jgi:putative phosphoribosyl transferase
MKEQRFRDRAQAGHLLVARLAAYANRPDALVLALPRGGVPVGYEVARALHVPLDVMIVRKLGVPGQEELALGAIASGGVCALNDDVIRALGIPEDLIHEVATREQHEVERSERLYRQGRPALEMHRRTAILVDDGMATGATMRAAVGAVKQQQPARIIIAVPVAASDTCEELAEEADEVVCLLRPRAFLAVGSWYQRFSQTTDEEVADLLARAARDLAIASPQRRETNGAESQQQCTGATPPALRRSRRISRPSHLSRNSQRQRQHSPQEVG